MSIVLKRPTTFKEQVSILSKDRNLIIDDEQYAELILSRLNYYRFSGYFRFFYKCENEFKENTRFEDIYNLYNFDIELRRLIMDLTEEIEINFRTYIAYYIAHEFEPEGYMDPDNFYDKDKHSEFINIVYKKVRRYKHKEYIKHHENKYKGKLPIWVLVEILSFTDLSLLYSNLKIADQKKIIMNNYSDKRVTANAKEVKNWIRVLCDLRNLCAHYERLCNVRMANGIKLPLEYKDKFFNNTLFSALIILNILIIRDNIWSEFLQKLISIIEKYKFENMEYMGFPQDWRIILDRKKD